MYWKYVGPGTEATIVPLSEMFHENPFASQETRTVYGPGVRFCGNTTTARSLIVQFSVRPIPYLGAPWNAPPLYWDFLLLLDFFGMIRF